MARLNYLFAVISAIAALVIIYLTSLDFFKSDQMSLSLQMMNLSEGEIIMLDVTEISIYIVLLILVGKSVIKKSKRQMVIISTFIWLFILIDLFIIESYFRNKVI